jgi:hypothetical protein
MVRRPGPASAVRPFAVPLLASGAACGQTANAPTIPPTAISKPSDSVVQTPAVPPQPTSARSPQAWPRPLLARRSSLGAQTLR